MVNDYPTGVLTVTGKDEDECRAKLFNMYGNAYKLLGKRSVPLRYGPFGLFQRDGIEMKYSVPSAQEEKKEFTDVTDPETVKRIKDEILRRATNGKTKEEIQLTELNNKLDNLTAQIANIPRASGGEDKIESIERIREMLDDNEFTKEFINEIELRLRKDFSIDDLSNFNKVERQVVDWIGESISIAPEKAHRPPHIIVIVGPTGVGKTTTIAKLAAQHFLLEKDNAPKMCMITLDNTRAGAEDQLRQIGGALQLNVYKAANASDLRSVYDSVRDDYDIIYIDTSGYSPNDSEKIADLKTTLSIENFSPDIYLAVTASTKSRDLKNIIQNYEPFGYNSVIVTKCDETTRFGNVISVFNEKHKPLSYIADGQRIAHNIRKANVVDFLIRLSGFSIDRIHIEDKFGVENGRSN